MRKPTNKKIVPKRQTKKKVSTPRQSILGNQFWKNRSKHGRDKLFASPELLWEAACEYFNWCDEHPWLSIKKTSFDKGEFSGDSKEEKPTQRPYSKSGLFLFIGCSDSWLKEFRKTCSNDFLLVIEQIEAVILTQQWEGAVIGAFKENIIARTQGLKDNFDNTSNGNEIKPTIILSKEEIKRISDELEDEYQKKIVFSQCRVVATIKNIFNSLM